MLTTQCMELVTSDVITQYKQHLKRYILCLFYLLGSTLYCWGMVPDFAIF